MLKRIMKVGIGLLAIAVSIVIALLITYYRWISGYKLDLENGSQIASTALGNIEFAIAGDGLPILRIHGRPGGYDAAIAGSRARPDDYTGFKTIAVSRPGYLRTPLTSGQTPAEQADLYAALLEKLEICCAVIYGVSAGAPSALQFAIRHPDKTIALVLVVPALMATNEEKASKPTTGRIAMFLQDFTWWLGGQVLAKYIGPIALHDYDPNDPAASARVQEVSVAFLASDLRAVGNENDLNQYRVLRVDQWPLEQIHVPTLFFHGNADIDAPYEGSVVQVARIPAAKLITFEGGEHTVVTSRGKQISDCTKAFVTQIARVNIQSKDAVEHSLQDPSCKTE